MGFRKSRVKFSPFCFTFLKIYSIIKMLHTSKKELQLNNECKPCQLVYVAIISIKGKVFSYIRSKNAREGI